MVDRGTVDYDFIISELTAYAAFGLEEHVILVEMLDLFRYFMNQRTQ